MSLLLSDNDLVARQTVAAGPLAPLAASLAADLDRVLTHDLHVPADKALLSREGGRCARDGTLLEFDPFERRAHRCPQCGTMYRGDLHDRFWIYWYQLWLAERAVHAVVLFRLGLGERFGALATRILDGYAARYLRYPNADNVLGPTRLFFSTYLESIWLLQICIATDLLDATDPALAARVRDHIIAPSRAVIAEYDEGASNRQVWNDAALLAASLMLDDRDGAERAVHGPSGVAMHLSSGLLADGTWYEGENYHLFAHRGLWYGVTLAERAGLTLPNALLQRFQLGFSTPFATALPDLTLPSRRDSQYAISLRQWRIAEHCELGLARRADPALLGALHRLYEEYEGGMPRDNASKPGAPNPDVPRRSTNRATSSADVERNGPPTLLTRADLSWRALLCARPSLPPLEPVPPRSVLLDAQGIAVFRRERGAVYVALDYGHSGGGHGHPDRLNVLLSHGDTRWLDDMGTGSYVDPSLHWYRSTLAHNAPLVGGTSQRRVDGRLLAYDERGAAGWIRATVYDIAPGARVTRTIVVMPEYMIDELEWSAETEDLVDLPIHMDLALPTDEYSLQPAPLEGGDGLEDGFRFARDTARQLVPARTRVVARASVPVPLSTSIVASETAESVEALTLWAVSDRDAEWWRATSLGPPGKGDQTFRMLRARAASGHHKFVMSWSAAVRDVECRGGDVHVTLVDGTAHIHRRDESGWHVDLHAGAAKSTIDLTGVVPEAVVANAPAPAPTLSAPPPSKEPTRSLSLRVGHQTTIELGEHEYRRSEQTWASAGRPTARVTLTPANNALHIAIEVPRSDRTFAPPGAVNCYDNEPADINGDGVQFYIRTEAGLSGWMLVPIAGSEQVAVRQLEQWNASATLRASWTQTGNGYRVDVSLQTLPQAMDVIINEMPRTRERRRGQLVLSGARGGGEFIYLQGDRHDAQRLLPLHVSHD